jgi:hypothetical protein
MLSDFLIFIFLQMIITECSEINNNGKFVGNIKLTSTSHGCFCTRSSLPQCLHSQRLWTLNWKSQSTRPDALRQHAKGPRHSKQYGVKPILRDAIVLQQYSRMCIDVGPWILNFACFFQYFWNNFIEKGNELEQGVVWHVRYRKLSLTGIPGICFSQHSMSKSRDDFPRL